MRTIATIIFIFVLAVSMGVLSVKAQDANTTLPASFFSAQDIADGAAKSFAELEAKVKELEAENAKLRAKLQPSSKLVMVSMPGCPACDQWWAIERPRYEAASWKVEHASESPRRGKRYPYWRVCIGDSCEEIQWVPFAQLDAKVQAILDRRKQ